MILFVVFVFLFIVKKLDPKYGTIRWGKLKRSDDRNGRTRKNNHFSKLLKNVTLTHIWLFDEDRHGRIDWDIDIEERNGL